MKPQVCFFSTGTGGASCSGFIRDPSTHEKFSEVVLIQTTYEQKELTYAKDLVFSLQQDPLIGVYKNS